MTLREIEKTTTLAQMAAGLDYDEETLQMLSFHFRNWHVNDNEEFPDDMRDYLQQFQRQYNLYLRNDMTQWDPMVQHYLESRTNLRQVLQNDNRDHQHEEISHEGEKVKRYGGHDTRRSEYNTDDTLRLNTSRGVIGNVYNDGSDSDKIIDKGTDVNKGLKQSNGRQHNYSDGRTLAGATPDSQVYEGYVKPAAKARAEADATDIIPEDPHTLLEQPTQPDIYTPPEQPTQPDIALEDPSFTPQQFPATEMPPVAAVPNGIPDMLSWKYLSQQQEQDNEAWQSANQIDATDGQNIKNAQRSELHKLGTHQHASQTEIMGGDNTREHRGHDEVTTTYGKTETEDLKNFKDIRDKKADGSASQNLGGVQTARESGRETAPPELLQKAQDYIQKSNAFRWLVKQLEPLFSFVLEAW